MRRFGQIARLKPEMTDEYTRLHASVWPSVLDVIAASNIVNYSIYILGDEVVSYFEYVGSDYEADMAKMNAAPAMHEWWKHSKPCFLHHEQNSYYTDMTEIFHCG